MSQNNVIDQKKPETSTGWAFQKQWQFFDEDAIWSSWLASRWLSTETCPRCCLQSFVRRSV